MSASAMYLSAEAILNGANRPWPTIRSRVPVCVSRNGRFGAVLFLGPRSDGGTQYFCVRGEEKDGRWRATDSDSDRWPCAPTDRALDGCGGIFMLAGAVVESDETASTVFAPGVCGDTVGFVRAEFDGLSQSFPIDEASGGFIVVMHAPGEPSLLRVMAGGRSFERQVLPSAP